MFAQRVELAVGKPRCPDIWTWAPPVPARRRVARRRCPRTPLAADGVPRLDYIGYGDDGYPSNDSFPMSQNRQHGNALHYAVPVIAGALDLRSVDAYAVADLLIHWREPRPFRLRRTKAIVPTRKKDPVRTLAADIMVAPGDGWGDTDSYQLFKGTARLADAMRDPVARQRAPLFILEVLSRTTVDRDRRGKRRIYRTMGVPEYWLFDPSLRYQRKGILGLALQGRRYQPIAPLPGTARYPSALLGLEFHIKETPADERFNENDRCRLLIRDPRTVEDYAYYQDLIVSRANDRQRAAEAELRAGEAERRAGQAEQQAEADRRRADAAEAELARLRRMLEAR